MSQPIIDEDKIEKGRQHKLLALKNKGLPGLCEQRDRTR